MEPMELEDRVRTNTRVAGGGTTGVDAKGDVIAGRDIVNIVNVTQINQPSTQVDSIKPFRIVAPPIHTFEDRQELLADVHKSLQDCLRQKHFMRRTVALVGIGGMGKTETVRKLVEKYGSFYENVAWIDSETESSAKQSFRELAQELDLAISPVENGKHLVKMVYRHIMKHDYKSPLFIFDNVNQLHSDGNVFGIFDFLPTDRTANLPLMLITSQTSEWRRYDCRVIQVAELNQTDSLEILYRRFKLTPDELIKKKDLGALMRQLSDKLEGYPLALGLAAANIYYLPGQDSLSLLKENIQEYIQCVDSPDFFEQRVNMNLATEYPHSLLKVWGIAMNNLERGRHAREAKHLLWILAFCPQEHLKQQRVARMYKSRCEALGVTFPIDSDATFEGAMYGLQLFGLVRRQENMIKIHRFIQDLSRRGDDSFFGFRKLLLYYDLQLQHWDNRFFERFLLSDGHVPPWALQNEATALLWLHNLNAVSPVTIKRFLQKNEDPLDQLLHFPNGTGMTQIGQFHLTAYSNIGLEPAIMVIEHSWAVFQTAIQLKNSLNPSTAEMKVVLELLILSTVDKFVGLAIEAMTLESYDPFDVDLPLDVFTSLRQWLCEIDYSTAVQTNLPHYLFDSLMSSVFQNFNLLQKSSLLHREGIQVISSEMLSTLAGARLLTCKETEKPYVSLELIEKLREVWNPNEVKDLIKNSDLLDHLAQALTMRSPDGAIWYLRQVVLGTNHAPSEAELEKLMRNIHASELWKFDMPSSDAWISIDLDAISPRLKERFPGIHGDIYFVDEWCQNILNFYSIAVTCIAISLRKVTQAKSLSQNLLKLLPVERYDHIERVMDAIHAVFHPLDHYVDIGNFLRYYFPSHLLWTRAELEDHHKDILHRAIEEHSTEAIVVGLVQKLAKFNRDLSNCTPSPELFVETDITRFEEIPFSEPEITTSDDETDTSLSD